MFKPQIGADPELFLVDNRSGSVHPVCGLVGGTKDKPIPLEPVTKGGKPLRKGFAVQEDNVMVEFNIPPAGSADAFSNNIETALSSVRALLRKKHGWLELDDQCARMFPYRLLSGKNEAQAKMFGCSADYDGHEMGRTVPPLHAEELDAEDGTWRFAGGHIHLGYVPPTMERGEFPIPDHIVAQFCDLYLGLPSVSEDKQGLRREKYGKAGRFRTTPYGIEYRTLSNFWVLDPNLRWGVANSAIQLANRLAKNSPTLGKAYSEIPWADVKAAIDNEDAKQAQRLLNFLHSDLNISI